MKVRLIERLRSVASRALRRRPRLATEVGEPEWVAAASRRGQFLAYADWVGIFTVDADGAVYFAERVDLADQFLVDDARLRNAARLAAAERTPALAHLRPVRGADDPDCPSCAGTGLVPLPPGAEGTIICECGGLGWLPAGYVDPQRPAG